jgi:hypothetical protein
MRKALTTLLCLLLALGGLGTIACLAQAAPAHSAHSCCHEAPTCAHASSSVRAHQAVSVAEVEPLWSDPEPFSPSLAPQPVFAKQTQFSFLPSEPPLILRI